MRLHLALKYFAVKGDLQWFKNTSDANAMSYSVVTGDRAFRYNWKSKTVARIGTYDAAKSNDTVQVGGGTVVGPPHPHAPAPPHQTVQEACQKSLILPP